MRVVRYLILLFRVLGVLALLVVAYWCIFPASLSALIKEETPAAAPAAPVEAALPTATLPEAVAKPAAPPLAAPVPGSRSQIAVAR